MAKRILSEYEMRKNMLAAAKELGCEGDLREIWAKYDRLLRNCKNEDERKLISIMGNQELHHLLSSEPGELIIGAPGEHQIIIK